MVVSERPHNWSLNFWCNACGASAEAVTDRIAPRDCSGGGNVIAISERVRTAVFQQRLGLSKAMSGRLCAPSVDHGDR